MLKTFALQSVDVGSPSRKAHKTRTADEFDIKKLQAAVAVPKGSGVPLTSWTLGDILSARDAQLRGDFARPAKMAEVMRTDDALAVARENRLAPLRCIKVEVAPSRDGARAENIAAEAAALFGQKGVGVTSETISSIASCLIDHDVAFAQTIPVPRDDGTRVDMSIRPWPIEHVRWDPYDGVFKTRIENFAEPPPGVEMTLGEMPIVHGDGRWIIFQRYDLDPFKHAALLAAAVVWARHAYAARDWAKGSVAHGSMKVLGTMPDGVPLRKDGGPTPEAAAMVELMKGFVASDSPAGLKPFGSTVEFVSSQSGAWEVWAKLIENAEKAAARIYLGTDGVLGSNGGAPGVDIQALFGVASTKVESDLGCITRGLNTAMEIWTAMNFGDSKLTPIRRYMVPDADADATRAAMQTRRTAFFADIDAARASGFEITQDYVDDIAKTYGILAPRLAVRPAPTGDAPGAPEPADAPPSPAAAPALRSVG